MKRRCFFVQPAFVAFSFCLANFTGWFVIEGGLDSKKYIISKLIRIKQINKFKHSTTQYFFCLWIAFQQALAVLANLCTCVPAYFKNLYLPIWRPAVAHAEQCAATLSSAYFAPNSQLELLSFPVFVYTILKELWPRISGKKFRHLPIGET